MEASGAKVFLRTADGSGVELKSMEQIMKDISGRSFCAEILKTPDCVAPGTIVDMAGRQDLRGAVRIFASQSGLLRPQSGFSFRSGRLRPH